MKLYESGEDYLEAVLMLQKKNGMVRSVDLARHMEVSKPSVCHAVATLRDGGFLMMDEDHFLHLTDVGREVAEKIYERHCFFTEQLIIAAGVDPKTAEADACRIEHIISDESLHRRWITVKMFLSIRYYMSLKSEEQEMYMRLTPREKEMADMFEQMSKEEQEIMIELAKRMRTEEPEKLLKEIKQRLNIDDGV